MLFDIDVKGALSIKKVFPEVSVLIFIAPPDVDELTTRLKNRNTESDETLSRRLARVPMELEQGKMFDYQVVNRVLADAIKEVESIISDRIRD